MTTSELSLYSQLYDIIDGWYHKNTRYHLIDVDIHAKHMIDQLIELIYRHDGFLLDRLEAKMPKERPYYKYEPKSGIGWNAAIADQAAVIKRIREEM